VWGATIALSASAVLVASVGPGSAAAGGLGFERRVSQAGVDGDASFRSDDVALAFSARANQYLAVWKADGTNHNEFEVFGRFLSRAGAPIGGQFQISTMGPAGDVRFDAGDPDVVYNPTANEYLVAWEGSDAVAGESEIFVQRLSPDGDRIGVDGQQVSAMGPAGDAAYDAREPSLAYNPAADEYLVAWRGDDDTDALVDNEFEIFIQRLDADGTELGIDDHQISRAHVDGAAGAFEPAVDYNNVTDEYLVAWAGGGATAPLVNDEFEIFVQRVAADGTEVGPNDLRISDMGPNGDADFFALSPTVAHNQDGEYLIAWEGRDDRGGTGISVFSQRLSASGTQLVPNDRRLSRIGRDGGQLSARLDPAMTFDPLGKEYVVVWSSDRLATVTGEVEILAQRLSDTGVDRGIDDQRISMQGPAGDLAFTAESPAVSFDPSLHRYLIAWHGDDDTGAADGGDVEIFDRTLGSS
jgi:hypothetical protein